MQIRRKMEKIETLWHYIGIETKAPTSGSLLKAWSMPGLEPVSITARLDLKSQFSIPSEMIMSEKVTAIYTLNKNGKIFNFHWNDLN